MTRFLVYVQTNYYPWAEAVEAETAEEAHAKTLAVDYQDVDAVVVLPFPEDAFTRGDLTYIEGLEGKL